MNVSVSFESSLRTETACTKVCFNLKWSRKKKILRNFRETIFLFTGNPMQYAPFRVIYIQIVVYRVERTSIESSVEISSSHDKNANDIAWLAAIN